MDFFDVIRARRSVRKYLPEPVPNEVMQKALDAALLAPNSSNMQPWEFYWVRSKEKKAALVEACLSQSAAKFAAELVVVVCRSDTWKRNRSIMIQRIEAEPDSKAKKVGLDYYNKVVPLAYSMGLFNFFGVIKFFLFNLAGLFRPIPRSPVSRSQLFHVLHKTTALACENFMLAMTAQGYGTCPMEGFDERRVKKILGLGRNSSVTMVISAGKVDPNGVWGEQIRFDRNLFVFEK